MSAVVDSSITSIFEDSMFKWPKYTNQSALAFHHYSLQREKNLLTDAVISSSDDKMYGNSSNPLPINHYIYTVNFSVFINLN